MYVEPFTVAWLVNECSETKEEGLETIYLRWVDHPMLGSTTCVRGLNWVFLQYHTDKSLSPHYIEPG